MRLTASARGKYQAYNATLPAGNEANGASIPAPIGGWDAFNPLAAMPPVNAVALVNWFPQPGYVELRRGHITHCDTGETTPVETVMGYQGIMTTDEALFCATNGKIIDVTTSSPSVALTGMANDRWQYTNFEATGGAFLWMCNGEDTPVYWDGSMWTTTNITISGGESPEDLVWVIPYRGRLWMALKDTTKAVYFDSPDAIDGNATVFDVGNAFKRGGYLNAIGTWSTDANDGPNEYICFISNYGDVALYLIEDPADVDKVFYRGTSQLGSPIGRRCLERAGADMKLITIDGVVMLSQVITYDKAAIQGAAVTKNIREAMTDAARNYSANFGWQIISYPRSTMVILNVPVSENLLQDQYVMNSLTGAWCRFKGQNANCWEVFQNRAYFGDNNGLIRLADEASGDEDQILSADMRGAFNYYGARGRLKQWTTIRPNITIDTAFPVQPYIGINVDFEQNALLDPITFGDGTTVPLWDDPLTAIWDESLWPGVANEASWVGINGIGYCASIHMTVDIPWAVTLFDPRQLRINGFDVLTQNGGFI